LVPAVTAAAANAKIEAEQLEDLAELAGLVPEPTAAADGSGAAAVTAWKQMVAGLEKRGERFGKALGSRRATAKRERINPPVMVRRQNFCNAEAVVGQIAGPER
jgi:hypothetical protein